MILLIFLGISFSSFVIFIIITIFLFKEELRWNNRVYKIRSYILKEYGARMYYYIPSYEEMYNSVKIGYFTTKIVDQDIYNLIRSYEKERSRYYDIV